MLKLRPLPPTINGLEPFYLIATWFQSGRIRPASGSWGSLAALPVCWIIKCMGGTPLILAFAIAAYFVGVWAVKKYLPHTKASDPSEVVIDEVIGMAVVWAFTPVNSLFLALLGFVFFRILDSTKPGPVGWCDRNIKGAPGVIVDDVVAGALAGLALALVQKLFL